MTKEIDDFIAEHERLNKIISEEASKGACITRGRLLKEVGMDEERLEQHLEAYDIDEAFVEALKDVYCTSSAIESLRKALKKL